MRQKTRINHRRLFVAVSGLSTMWYVKAKIPNADDTPTEREERIGFQRIVAVGSLSRSTTVYNRDSGQRTKTTVALDWLAQTRAKRG